MQLNAQNRAPKKRELLESILADLKALKNKLDQGFSLRKLLPTNEEKAPYLEKQVAILIGTLWKRIAPSVWKNDALDENSTEFFRIFAVIKDIDNKELQAAVKIIQDKMGKIIEKDLEEDDELLKEEKSIQSKIEILIRCGANLNQSFNDSFWSASTTPFIRTIYGKNQFKNIFDFMMTNAPELNVNCPSLEAMPLFEAAKHAICYDDFHFFNALILHPNINFNAQNEFHQNYTALMQVLEWFGFHQVEPETQERLQTVVTKLCEETDVTLMGKNGETALSITRKYENLAFAKELLITKPNRSVAHVNNSPDFFMPDSYEEPKAFQTQIRQQEPSAVTQKTQGKYAKTHSNSDPRLLFTGPEEDEDRKEETSLDSQPLLQPTTGSNKPSVLSELFGKFSAVVSRKNETPTHEYGLLPQAEERRDERISLVM